MIPKTEVSWNDDFEHDGLLYFFQRLIEMLDYNTSDLFKAPLMNTCRLIHEYLTSWENDVKNYHATEILNEFLETFKNDIIIQHFWGQLRIEQIINQIHQSPENKTVVFKYLERSINPHYFSWTKEYLTTIIPQSREKKKIDRATRCFIPELLRRGYSSEYVYRHAKSLLRSSSAPQDLLSSFLNRYDNQDQEYSVYISISKELVAFKDILSEKLDVCFDDDGNFGKLITKKKDYHTCCIKTQSLDPFTAASDSFDSLELFTSFYQCYGDFTGQLVHNKVLVIDDSGNSTFCFPRHNRFSSTEENDPPSIGEIAEISISSILRRARSTLPDILKIVKLHNRAISNNGLENGFLNLWSILEIICVHDSSSKIQQVVANVTPILKRDYLSQYFSSVATDINNLFPEEYKQIISLVDEPNDEKEKIACFILLDKYANEFDKFIDSLILYPVLRSRLLLLNDKRTDLSALYQLALQYTQRISWHLYRIYRARNTIAHAGKTPENIKDLGEHLHSYVDSIALEIILKLAMCNLGSIPNLLLDSSLLQTNIDLYFKSKKPVDLESMRYIFPNSVIWANISFIPL